MEPTGNLREALIARTLRVPLTTGASGDGSGAARRLDVTLLSVGFKCSRELLDHLSHLHPAVVHDVGEVVLRAVRELVGDHVRHNAYFIAFPKGVPDTVEFWNACVEDALADPRSSGHVAAQLARGWVNLLDLRRYGRYQHTYEEMLAAHEPLIAAAEDRLTILGLGGSLTQESYGLYLSLAASPVPLSEGDLGLLGTLAGLHAGDDQPDEVPMRESRAVINAARLAHDLLVDVDTTVDVLRLACALSGGDVTLSTPTRVRSLRRAERRRLMAALDDVVRSSPAKLADVGRYAEPFKRLGERLHPHEYPHYEAAQDVFAVARGERTARSLAARVQLAMEAGDADEALRVLAIAPGMLIRSVDWLARAGADPDTLADAVRGAAPAVSTRVLVSLREHLLNREEPGARRVFVNQQGRSWVAPDERAPLPAATRAALQTLLDDELAARLPRVGELVVDPAVRTLAVPQSDKTRPAGIGIMPRGSVLPLGRHVRFFVHWKQRARRTDYDLSVLMLDREFRSTGQVSWTNLEAAGAVHSGDLTEAPAGASEFIDLDLGTVAATYVVPQVNVYAGESFDRAEEAFFGFMQSEPEQQGRPFEPRTVRAKSDLSGTGRVSLPVLFARGDDGGWHAKWLHLNLAGRMDFNQVELNRLSTSLVVRAIYERRYLTIAYLEELLRRNVTPDGAMTYIGLDRPEDPPAGSAIFTPGNITELLNSV